VSTTCSPDISVIVELDNVLHGEVARAQTMLARLLDQLRENALESRAEVLVMYDETEIRPKDAERIVTATTIAEHPFVKLVATNGLRYFSLKNEGVRRAKGDVIVFVDSDCLPEHDWLRRLLEPLRDPTVDVVTGNSYIDRDTFYAKTFAAGWYFPSRLPDGPLVPVRTTFANTLAIRRHVFEKYPFPEESSLYMGQGVLWNRTLFENGVPIFLNPSARVAHPPPVFLRSAIVNGYDTAQRTRQPGDTKLWSLKVSYWGLRQNLSTMFRRIMERYREVGIPRVAVPLAIGLAGVYWSLWSFFELVARWAPGLIPHKHLR
jgi:glycosyltransferase involved in cell wall biosynthesis